MLSSRNRGHVFRPGRGVLDFFVSSRTLGLGTVECEDRRNCCRRAHDKDWNERERVGAANAAVFLFFFLLLFIDRIQERDYGSRTNRIRRALCARRGDVCCARIATTSLASLLVT